MGIDKVGIDKVGIDKVGIDKVGITPKRIVFIGYVKVLNPLLNMSV